MKTLLAFILLLVMSVSVQAQQQNTVWHWAWNQDTGELFAYSPTGTVNLLTDELNTIYQFGEIWRVSDAQAIALATIDDMQTLYLLDSVSAQPVELIFDEATWQYYLDSSFILEPTAYAYPYLALTTSLHTGVYTNERLRTRPTLLLNLDTRQIYLLSENSQPVARFSADGQHLRYLHLMMTGETFELEIREYDVASNTETIAYRFQEDLLDSVIQVEDADIHGERWLISRTDDPYYIDVSHRLISLTTQTIYTLHTFNTDNTSMTF
ncbi:MAG: hypothetical protein AAFR81_17390 [Chloroflexota bacterium]